MSSESDCPPSSRITTFLHLFAVLAPDGHLWIQKFSLDHFLKLDMSFHTVFNYKSLLPLLFPYNLSAEESRAVEQGL